MSIESAFERLTGELPDDTQRLRLYRIKDALKLSEDDPIWLVFMATEQHRKLLDEAPEKLAHAVEEGLGAISDVLTINADILADAKDAAVAAASVDFKGLESGVERLKKSLFRLPKIILAVGLLVGLAAGATAGFWAAKFGSERLFFAELRADQAEHFQRVERLEAQGVEVYADGVIFPPSARVVQREGDGSLVVRIPE